MKQLRFFSLALAVLAALLLVLAGCGKKGPASDAPDAQIPEGYDENVAQTEYASALDRMNALDRLEEDEFVRTASSGDALNTVLQSGKDKTVGLSTTDAAAVTIPTGDHSSVTLTIDAANAAVTSDAAFGAVIAQAVGEGGLTLNARVGELAVFGQDISVMLADGADTVYVRGKNCTLTLTGGSFGKIITLNQTVVIVNNTGSDVTVVTANGAAQTLPAGETLRFE